MQKSTEKLRRRFFFYFASALLVLAIGLTTAISMTLFGSLKDAEDHGIVHIAEIRSIAIAEWCRRAKDIAKQITSRTQIRQELEKYNAKEIDLEQVKRFTKPKLQDAMNLSDEVKGIIRLGVANEIVAACGFGPDLIAANPKVENFVTDDVVISDPLALKSRRLLIVSAPIFSRTGVRQGTDLVMMDMELLQKMLAGPREMGETSAIVICYRSGDSVVPLVPVKTNGNRSAAETILSDAIQDSISKAIDGKAGFTYAADRALAFFPIEECDWGLVVTQNRNELYSKLYTKIMVIAAMSLIIYFLILCGFWLILKPLSGRLLLHTDELEKKVQEKTESLEREIIERKKTENEKEIIITELREAMQKIKTLSGMLPICSNCKKIRDDKGYWNQIEAYIHMHSEAEFSHSICPECAKKLYPGLKIHEAIGCNSSPIVQNGKE